MLEDDVENDEEKPRSRKKEPAVIRLPSAGNVEVTTEDEPPRPPADKKIHRRRPLPPVPDKRSD